MLVLFGNISFTVVTCDVPCFPERLPGILVYVFCCMYVSFLIYFSRFCRLALSDMSFFLFFLFSLFIRLFDSFIDSPNLSFIIYFLICWSSDLFVFFSYLSWFLSVLPSVIPSSLHSVTFFSPFSFFLPFFSFFVNTLFFFHPCIRWVNDSLIDNYFLSPINSFSLSSEFLYRQIPSSVH